MIDSIACSFSITGQGPPLFLIHGIGASRQTRYKAMPALAAHFTVVTYDLRGHGEPPLPDGDFVLDDLDELAKSLLICTRQEMIDKLVPCAELGIDQLILSPNFGSDPQRTCDALQHFAQDVMPFFTGSSLLLTSILEKLAALTLMWRCRCLYQFRVMGVKTP